MVLRVEVSPAEVPQQLLVLLAEHLYLFAQSHQRGLQLRLLQDDPLELTSLLELVLTGLNLLPKLQELAL